MNKEWDFRDFIYAYSQYSKLSVEAYNPNLFEWVGLTERYSKSLVLLKSRYPFLKIDQVKVMRKNPDRKLTDSYSEQHKPLIKKLLAVEYQLYELAKKRFNSDCEKMGLT